MEYIHDVRNKRYLNIKACYVHRQYGVAGCTVYIVVGGTEWM